jgi:hypothetical protein
MIESDLCKVTAAALQAAMGDFRCEKMLRAWRNRSPVTQAAWLTRASALLTQTPASPNDRGELAAALYVACGELCGPPGTFAPAAWPMDEWQRLAALLPGIVKYRPEKLLSRGEYCTRRQAIGSKP